MNHNQTTGEAREREVPSAMSAIRRSVEKLQEVVAEIGGRLQPALLGSAHPPAVAVPTPPSIVGEKRLTERANSALAAQLFSFSDQVESARDELGRILALLEL